MPLGIDLQVLATIATLTKLVLITLDHDASTLLRLSSLRELSFEWHGHSFLRVLNSDCLKAESPSDQLRYGPRLPGSLAHFFRAG